MCSVIGYSPLEPTADAVPAFERLWQQSILRGTHAFGIAWAERGFIAAARSHLFQDIPLQFDPTKPTIAHTRYAQSGDWRVMKNNQPLVVGNMALAMNGVLHMGTKEEFEAAFGVTCEADNDSEIFLRCLEKGERAADFITRISGSFAAVWLRDGKLYAGRNARRPLYYATGYGGVWYASTADIFLRAGFERPTLLTPNTEWM